MKKRKRERDSSWPERKVIKLFTHNVKKDFEVRRTLGLKTDFFFNVLLCQLAKIFTYMTLLYDKLMKLAQARPAMPAFTNNFDPSLIDCWAWARITWHKSSLIVMWA